MKKNKIDISAEQFLIIWHERKYKGGKELPDWTPEEVIEFAEAYKNECFKQIK